MNKKNKRGLVIITIAILICLSIGGINYILLNDNNSKTDFSKYTEKSVSKATTIKNAGVYNLSGNISGQVLVDAEDKEIKLVLKNVTIKTTNSPCIYIKNAKSVDIEIDGENTLSGTTDTNLNGLIYSKSDITFEGDGTLNITSDKNAIATKKALYINGGTFNITTGSGATTTVKEFDNNSSKNSTSIKGIKASDVIEITNGNITINSEDDSIHSNADIKISGGTFNLKSSDDAIHADSLLEITGGKMDIEASEGLEATYIKIKDGTINIEASDDGINAAQKVDTYTPTVEINGGTITINMGAGDTDGIDSNGNLYINGGTLNISGQSPFDYDGDAKYTGGTMVVNGEETTTITNQMIGGGGGHPGDNQAPQRGPEQNMNDRNRGGR